MNATKWHTLTDFVKYLGREGYCIVDETPKVRCARRRTGPCHGRSLFCCAVNGGHHAAVPPDPNAAFSHLTGMVHPVD